MRSLRYIRVVKAEGEKQKVKNFKLLKGYGENLQYSIFRCRLSQRDREKLRWELEKILEAEDSLLIAGLCDRCVERIQACNRPETWTVEEEKFRIF
ncbi:MAG: CRISPR-associated endonuclease Cas2 [Leptodesmis sp.]|uniref:CRISPR-associated endonuclease Cas2 n=1 Tax=Leptodesmis sp. TaxID=3100501 RepID=UPI003D0DD09E